MRKTPYTRESNRKQFETKHLGVLDNTDLGWSQDASIEHEALLLGKKDDAVLLIWLRCLEDSLVEIRVEFLAGLGGVEALKAVLLQCVDKNAVCHLDTLVQGSQVLVVTLELLGCYSRQCTVEVIDRLDEVASETLDGEILGRLSLTRCALLKVAKVCD